MTSRWLAPAALLAASIAGASCGVAHTSAFGSIGFADRHLAAFTAADIKGEDPGGLGEVRALAYARNYLESLGLKTFLQPVPLIRMVPITSKVVFHGPKGGSLDISATGENFIVWPGLQEAHVQFDAAVVFAGYGVVAPEYQRDDYKVADVKGKIVIVLEGPPMTGDRDDLGMLGDTYYGTDTYKFTEAARHGAAGVLIVPKDQSAWTDIQTTTNGSVIELDRRAMTGHDDPAPQVEGWLSRPAVERLFGLTGLDFATQLTQAHELAFKPVPLIGNQITIELESKITRYPSNNLIAVLEGKTSEYVMLTARWNRVPISGAHSAPTALMGDDGSGAAAVLDAARRLSQEHPRPLRTVVFLIATGLEPGVIGLERYTENPPASLPLDQMTALILMDHADLEGKSRRVGKIGVDDDTALSQIARDAAIEQGRLLELDDDPERSFYYAAAETEFGRTGVRALYLSVPPMKDSRDRRLRDLSRRDKAVGLETPHDAAPWQDPLLLTNIVNRVANATNWPARIEPAPIR